MRSASRRPGGWRVGLSCAAAAAKCGWATAPTPDPACIDHSWHAYLYTDDAAGLYDEVRSKGAEIWHPLADKPWGWREFAVVTPEGRRIVFGQAIA